ncbi:DUF6760 family protein [Amycolatopsis anabasis]|uniref:DUF6760 family protein n=1 Tax=Amycolatopsis anabasis TaxID=1840409 RepID=UPI0031B587F3
MLTYAADRLWEEVAYLAYYLHWSFDEILGLEHPARERIIAEVGTIHARYAREGP